MSDLYKLFKELGFSDKQYETIINDPQITLREESLYKAFLKNVSLFLKNGYEKEAMVKIIMSNHSLTYLDLNKKIDAFNSLGYDENTFFTMLKRCPKLVNIGKENIVASLEDLKRLGYDEDVLKNMTIEGPELLEYDFERIKSIFKIIMDSNYTKEEVLIITSGYPAVYGSDLQRLKIKLDYYNSIGLHDYIVDRPKDLIQGAATTYARYQYFVTNDIEINKTTRQSLFKKESSFKKQYGVEKAMLLQIWKFSDYVANLKTNSKKKINTNTNLG